MMTTLRSTARTEAFSDGVMAIAITLLILNVHVDTGYASAHGLLRALNHEWPAYLAYITAFLTIAIMWLNHHALFDKIRQVDKSLAWTNLALLLTISVLPFPTSVVAQYLRAGGTDAKVAVSFYGLLSTLNGFAWLGSWVHLARYPDCCRSPTMPPTRGSNCGGQRRESLRTPLEPRLPGSHQWLRCCCSSRWPFSSR